MLLKLLKYDFRAMWKQFSLIWGAALVLAAAHRFTWASRLAGGDAADFVTFALFAVIVAMFVICVTFIIQRFSKGLLGNEGYLMHTLPVRPWELVVSKLICAVAVCVGSGIVALLTPFLMTPWLHWWEDLNITVLVNLFRGIWKHPDIITLGVEFCVLMLSTLVMGISTMYLAMSVGHLVSRHRKLVSVAAFIGLYILLGNVYSRVFSWEPIEFLVDAVDSSVHTSMLAASATVLIPAAVFLAVTCWILENKLNLE